MYSFSKDIHMSFYCVESIPFYIAKELFIKHLTPFQYKTFIELDYIIVISNKKHKYRINTHKNYMNIIRLDGWFISKRKFCIQLKNELYYPHYDHILAQKLLIESDEDFFLQKAKRFIT
jgi:hypothetical protein